MRPPFFNGHILSIRIYRNKLALLVLSGLTASSILQISFAFNTIFAMIADSIISCTILQKVIFEIADVLFLPSLKFFPCKTGEIKVDNSGVVGIIPIKFFQFYSLSDT
jgi:hypothetical protein